MDIQTSFRSQSVFLMSGLADPRTTTRLRVSFLNQAVNRVAFHYHRQVHRTRLVSAVHRLLKIQVQGDIRDHRHHQVPKDLVIRNHRKKRFRDQAATHRLNQPTSLGVPASIHQKCLVPNLLGLVSNLLGLALNRLGLLHQV